jgi:hypothetical protein
MDPLLSSACGGDVIRSRLEAAAAENSAEDEDDDLKDGQKVQDFLQRLAALRQRNPAFKKAVDNVRADIRLETNPHGNLSTDLVASIDDDCRTGKPVERAIEDHWSTNSPRLHRRCLPPSRVRRVMARSDFVSYHVLRGSADQSETELWTQLLSPGEHKFDGSDFSGRTGPAGRPCWWSFEEAERPISTEGRLYVAELALGESQRRRAERDRAVVEVVLDADRASDRYNKPTSLEGFGPDTPFRPELSGMEYGRTAPADPQLHGWPEVVSSSAEYLEIFEEDTDVEVRVLSYPAQS